jgi:hypothetical protein
MSPGLQSLSTSCEVSGARNTSSDRNASGKFSMSIQYCAQTAHPEIDHTERDVIYMEPGLARPTRALQPSQSIDAL